MWRLLQDVAIGDLVVMPLKPPRAAIAIGRIIGEYRYRVDQPPGFRHVRDTEWIATDVPRSAVQQDLLDSLGSQLTICRLVRFGAQPESEAPAARGRERSLFYVACSRARDELIVTWAGAPSPFLPTISPKDHRAPDA